MIKRPVTISITEGFVLLQIFISLGFGVIVLEDLHPAMPDLPVYRAVMGTLGLLGAVVLAALFLLLRNRMKWGYVLALSIFAGLAVLTFLDDVGWADAAFLVIVVIPLVLLIKDRRWYLSNIKSKEIEPIE